MAINVDDIRATLANVYEGTTWYGKNIWTTIQDVPVGKALLRLEESYNIAELVSHMLAWRNYTIKLLETGQHHEVPEVENFPRIEVMMMDDWMDLIDRFQQSQHRLMSLLDDQIDLNVPVPKKPYLIQDVLLGIIHHDIYHAGQLNLLAKFL